MGDDLELSPRTLERLYDYAESKNLDPSEVLEKALGEFFLNRLTEGIVSVIRAEIALRPDTLTQIQDVVLQKLIGEL